jgi:triphosphatase
MASGSQPPTLWRVLAENGRRLNSLPRFWPNVLKKISDQIEKIEELDLEHRHKLRIAVKKLRYACDFFAGVFDGPGG